jgi:tetratricopeptide (TPR) repeat protein
MDMRKLNLLTAALLFVAAAFAQNANGKWDHSMEIRQCNVWIETNLFVANTTVELELFNNAKDTAEALFNFNLATGQVVNDLQLDLNGRYREGSIEEKWKARTTYRTIVGKRIDPAILQLNYNNNYSLNVFPVAGHSSRKVKFSFTQYLKREGNELVYNTAFLKDKNFENCRIEVTVKAAIERAIAKKGMLLKDVFSSAEGKQRLTSVKNKTIGDTIAFVVPVASAAIASVQQTDSGKLFLLRMLRNHAVDQKTSLQNALVYWDISTSAASDSHKFIDFLQQYIHRYNVKTLTIVPFNTQTQAAKTFDVRNALASGWKLFLQDLQYGGATDFSCLNLQSPQADAVFVATDGKSSFGNTMPAVNGQPFFVLTNAANKNTPFMFLCEDNGGMIVSLANTTIKDAVGVANNYWMQLQNNLSQKTKGLQVLLRHQEKNELVFLGLLKPSADSMLAQWQQKTMQMVQVAQPTAVVADAATISQLKMLHQYSEIEYSQTRDYANSRGYWYGNWYRFLKFGLAERVVTPNTSFLVLERLEDYINYKIAPPKDLEAACKDAGYVYEPVEMREWQRKKRTADELLPKVVSVYNEQLKWLGDHTALIDLNKPYLTARQQGFFAAQESVENQLVGKVSGVMVSRSDALSEVVVTGYGTMRRKEMIGVVSITPSRGLFGNLSLDQALAGKIAGVQVGQANGSPGAVGSIHIRGISSLSNNSQPLIVLDGIPLAAYSSDVAAYLNMNDVKTVEVYKAPQAAALYGSRGSNGVIVINSKREHRNFYQRQYNSLIRLQKLNDVDYVEDFNELADTAIAEQLPKLEATYSNDYSFYIDIAQLLYQKGMHEKAKALLMSLAEKSETAVSILKAIGYVFEWAKAYEDAIATYEKVWELEKTPANYRNLALAHYQKGDTQKAVDLLFDGLLEEDAYNYWYDSQPANQSILLTDLNALVAAHGSSLDLSRINLNLLQPTTVAMRFVAESNTGAFSGFSVLEPGKSKDSLLNHPTKVRHNYGYSLAEYLGKENRTGKYLLHFNSYDYGYYNYNKQPNLVKVVKYQNFGKPNQQVSVELVPLTNQHGKVQVAF